MATFGERLRELRKASRMTQKELGAANDIGESSVSMYEQGYREPDIETIEALADFFNVDLNYLFGRTDTTTFIPVNRVIPTSRMIPVYGRIPAGIPFEAIEDLQETVEVPRWLAQKENIFGLKVVGDSMSRIVPDGYIAIIQKVEMLENGEIGAIMVNGSDATLKKFFRLTDYVVLEPLSYNAEHKPMMIGKDDPEVIVIGKMLWACAAHEL